MRSDRIAKRWNLKSRAKAGRFLVNQQRRLNESALNYYKAGYADRALEEAKQEQPRRTMTWEEQDAK